GATDALRTSAPEAPSAAPAVRTAAPASAVAPAVAPAPEHPSPAADDVSPAAVVARDAASILGTYARTPFHPRTGRGARLVDADGRVVWDLLAGIAVNALGHRHPRLVRALREESTRLLHVSNLFYH